MNTQPNTHKNIEDLNNSLTDKDRDVLQEIFNEFLTLTQLENEWERVRKNMWIENQKYIEIRNKFDFVKNIWKKFREINQTIYFDEFFKYFRNLYIKKGLVSDRPNNYEISDAVPFVDGHHNYTERVQDGNDIPTATPVNYVKGNVGGRRKSRRNRKSKKSNKSNRRRRR